MIPTVCPFVTSWLAACAAKWIINRELYIRLIKAQINDTNPAVRIMRSVLALSWNAAKMVLKYSCSSDDLYHFPLGNQGGYEVPP